MFNSDLKNQRNQSKALGHLPNYSLFFNIMNCDGMIKFQVGFFFFNYVYVSALGKNEYFQSFEWHSLNLKKCFENIFCNIFRT